MTQFVHFQVFQAGLAVFPRKAQRGGQVIAALLDGERRKLPPAPAEHQTQRQKAERRRYQRGGRPERRMRKRFTIRQAGQQHGQQRKVRRGGGQTERKGRPPTAARRAHAAKQRGDGSNQQQRAEQPRVKRVHPPSPPRSKESVAHGAPSASSIVSRPFCA